jgi:uncharacterized protein YndB with AHSA1/START domain
MSRNLIAESIVTVNAPARDVWKALVTPAAIRQYMFGADVASTWKEGAPITWKGEWKGKPYEDKGVIQRFEPERALQYTHYSPLAGLPDLPENYHTVTVELSAEGGATRVTLAQDNNSSEQAREHSKKNWDAMLGGLKKYVEASAGKSPRPS